MIKQAYTMIAMLVVLGCLAVSAKAQCGDKPAVATIPFEFRTGHATLPAGQYGITCPDRAGGVMQLSAFDGETIALTFTAPVESNKNNGFKLVFHRYGNQYFLAQAWFGALTGLQLPKSRAERVVMRELKISKPKSATIALTRQP